MDNTAVKIITYFRSLEEFLIGVLFFTLPFGWIFSIIPLVLFFVTLSVNTFTKPEKPNKEKTLYFLPPIILFGWNALSLFYSQNLSEGTNILCTQIIFPIAAIVFLFNKIPQSTIQKALLMFLIGCVCSVALMYGMAFYHSSSIVGDAFIFSPFHEHAKGCTLDTDICCNFFLGSDFSSLVHPAYNALLLGIAMLIILKNIRSDSAELMRHYLWIAIFTLFGMAIIQFSFNGTLALAISIIFTSLVTLSTHRDYYTQHSRAVYCSLLILFCFIFINPQMRSITSGDIKPSISRKIEVSRASIQVISENWLMGTGIGDVSDEMKIIYSRTNNDTLIKKNYNSHNQFLTTWSQSGIVGLLLLLWCIFTISFRAHKKKILILHLFNTIVIISFLFESMLVRYWGVLTYILFYCIFYFYSENDTKGL